MYLFTIIYVGLNFACSEPQLFLKDRQIGETCNGNTNFAVSSFLVSSWPPQKNQILSFNMTGTFSLIEKIAQLSIMTSFNRQNWEFRYEILNKEYNDGETVSFIYTIPISNVTGNYLEQLVLEKFKPQHQYVSCWQFTYSLT
jgi:hypothetical protein